ncbi:hypothetical protein [uncultured Flavobacterium sp.]|uniref:hypothetical protein n=1 Tax=uncultured Flavobacterium sp. TaxID=165435 RepID=UPI0030EBD7C4|tara:strand:- start:18530 stop:19048 length:519 start_codon:yes stop_codon:yes gene_type:complete
MKKITLILAFIGMITLNSCTVNDTPPPAQVQQINNTYVSEVFEVTTSFSSNNDFSRLVTFNPPIYNSDTVLVYRLSGVSNGTDFWKLLPETFYFNDGTLDYKFNYDFTRYDVELYMEGFELWNLSSQILNNQTFRLVVIPGSFKTSNEVDYSDYNATIKMLGYKDSKIKKLD